MVAKCQVRVDYWDKICFEVFLCGKGEQVMSQVYQNLLCLNTDLFWYGEALVFSRGSGGQHFNQLLDLKLKSAGWFNYKKQ